MGVKRILFLIIISFLYFIGIWFTGKIYLADRYYNQGLVMEKGGRWLEAIPLYEKAISLDSKSVTFYESLGRLYLLRSWFPLEGEGFLLRARDTVEEGLSLCPQNGDLWLLQGMILERFSEKEALSAYNKSISFDPHNAFYHAVLSTFYLKRGREKEGIFEAKKAALCYNPSCVYDYLKKMGIDERTVGKIQQGRLNVQ